MDNASEETLAAIRARFGLDQPLYVQYVRWLGRAVQGDLGVSLRTSEPVLTSILDRLPITLGLALASTALGVLLGVPLAVIAAHRGGVVDTLARGIASLGVAMPNFWLGGLLVMVIALELRWL